MQPVRVLQISYAMDFGGAETLLMNLYRNIDRSKVQFDFLLHCNYESAYEKEINELGGRIYRIPRYSGYNKLSYEKNLKEFLLSHPEHIIIHDHLMYSASETLRVAKKMGRITIAHSHAADTSVSLAELIRFPFRMSLWKIADYRFACSQEAGKWLYRDKADFIVLRNGIKTEDFRFSGQTRAKKRLELGIKDTAKVIGTVGRLVKLKNQVRLPHIMKELSEIEKDSVLLIVGEGPLEDDIKETAKQLGMQERLIFTGARKDVNELLSAMDTFVLPSLSEGLGIVLVEAQASGLPCIFTDTLPKDVDLIDCLVHRVSLSSPDSEWAKTISESKTLGQRESACEIVKDKGYDISTSAKQLQDFYLSLSD